MYKLIRDGLVTRLVDLADIPLGVGHPEESLYQEWLDAGNTPTPADPPSKEEENAPILAELQANDLAIIRSICEGDTGRITAHNAKQAALRAKLKP